MASVIKTTLMPKEVGRSAGATQSGNAVHVRLGGFDGRPIEVPYPVLAFRGIVVPFGVSLVLGVAPFIEVSRIKN